MGEFSRVRPHLNLCVTGHHKHGKTTLAAALTMVLSKRPDRLRTRALTVQEVGLGLSPRPPAELELLPENSPRRPRTDRKKATSELTTVRANLIEYETPQRHIGHFDCPGRSDRLKNVLRVAALCDAGLLVVSAETGVMPQTREHMLALWACGFEKPIVFLNACDAVQDPLQLDLAEEEVRGMALECGLRGNELTVLRGSATKALEGVSTWQSALLELAEVIDYEIPPVPQVTSGPVVLAVDRTHVASSPSQILVSGVLRSGVLRKGQRLVLRGMVGDGDFRFQVESVEVFHDRVQEALPGDDVGVLLSTAGNTTPITRRLFRGGVMLATPEAVPCVRKVRVRFRALSSLEGGRHTSFSERHIGKIFIGHMGAGAKIIFSEGPRSVEPGARDVQAVFELSRALPLQRGQRFVFVDGCDGYRKARGARNSLWGGTALVGHIESLE